MRSTQYLYEVLPMNFPLLVIPFVTEKKAYELVGNMCFSRAIFTKYLLRNIPINTLECRSFFRGKLKWEMF